MMDVLDQDQPATEILPELIAPLAAEYAHLGYHTEDAQLLALLRDVTVLAACRRLAPGRTAGTAAAQVLAEAARTLTSTGDLTLPDDLGYNRRWLRWTGWQAGRTRLIRSRRWPR